MSYIYQRLLLHFFDTGGEEGVEFRAYAFHESYALAQSIHCQVAVSSVFVIACCPVAVWLMLVPLCSTASLGIFWRHLSLMADRDRAHQLGANFAFWVAATTPSIANVVASLYREHLLAIPSLGSYYWLLFSEFFLWLHTIYLTPARLHAIHAITLSVNVLMPSFTTPSEVQEFTCLLITMTASITLGSALERQCRNSFHFRQRAEAERVGDSRLNHVIKNKACAATFITKRIEDTLEDTLRKRTGEAPPFAAQSDEILAQLRTVSSILYQCSEWCHLRELFVQLQSGLYVSAAVPTSLDELITRVAGRPTREGTAVRAIELTRSPSCPAELLIDPSILMLCLEEAFSNIAKYSEPSEPTRIRLYLLDDSPYAPAASSAAANAATAPRMLHVYVDSLDRPGTCCLSPDECTSLMGRGSKRVATDGSNGQRRLLSDGLGLDTILRACNAVGGSARLSSFTDAEARNHTRLHMVVPASLCKAEAAVLEGAQAPRADSGVSPPRSTDDSASAAAAALSSHRCLALDDDAFMRAYLAAVLEALDVHPDSAVLGEDGAASVDRLLAVATDGDVDVALIILDENLHLSPMQTFRGSEIAVQLRQRGYRGRICILSGESLANSSRLASMAEVDLVLVKGTLSFVEVRSRLHALLDCVSRSSDP